MALSDLIDDCLQAILNWLDDMSLGSVACVSHRFQSLALANPSYGISACASHDYISAVPGKCFYARALCYGHTRLVPEQVVENLSAKQLFQFRQYDLVKRRLLTIWDERFRRNQCAILLRQALRDKDADFIIWILSVVSEPGEQVLLAFEKDEVGTILSVDSLIEFAMTEVMNREHPLVRWAKSVPLGVERHLYTTSLSSPSVLRNAMAHGRSDTVSAILVAWEWQGCDGRGFVLNQPRVSNGLDLTAIWTSVLKFPNVKFTFAMLLDACLQSSRPMEEASLLLQYWQSHGSRSSVSPFRYEWPVAVHVLAQSLSTVPTIEGFELACEVIEKLFDDKMESEVVIAALAERISQKAMSLRSGLPLLRHFCSENTGLRNLHTSVISFFNGDAPLQRKHLPYFRDLLALYGGPRTKNPGLTEVHWRRIRASPRLSYMVRFLRDAGVEDKQLKEYLSHLVK